MSVAATLAVLHVIEAWLGQGYDQVTLRSEPIKRERKM